MELYKKLAEYYRTELSKKYRVEYPYYSYATSNPCALISDINCNNITLTFAIDGFIIDQGHPSYACILYAEPDFEHILYDILEKRYHLIPRNNNS